MGTDVGIYYWRGDVEAKLKEIESSDPDEDSGLKSPVWWRTDVEPLFYLRNPDRQFASSTRRNLKGSAQIFDFLTFREIVDPPKGKMRWVPDWDALSKRFEEELAKRSHFGGVGLWDKESRQVFDDHTSLMRRFALTVADIASRKDAEHCLLEWSE